MDTRHNWTYTYQTLYGMMNKTELNIDMVFKQVF